MKRNKHAWIYVIEGYGINCGMRVPKGFYDGQRNERCNMGCLITGCHTKLQVATRSEKRRTKKRRK
jgi:hypothetical protein